MNTEQGSKFYCWKHFDDQCDLSGVTLEKESFWSRYPPSFEEKRAKVGAQRYINSLKHNASLGRRALTSSNRSSRSIGESMADRPLRYVERIIGPREELDPATVFESSTQSGTISEQQEAKQS